MASEIHTDPQDQASVYGFLENVLDLSRSSQTELLFDATKRSLTRFAGNQIHQNVTQTDRELSIRLIEDGCIGHAAGNLLDPDSLHQSLDWAGQVAASGRIHAEPSTFAGPQEYAPIADRSGAATLSPQQRAEIVAGLVDECSSQGAEAAGAVSNIETVIAIANSNGLRSYHRMHDTEFTATVSVDGSTGWVSCQSADPTTLDAENMGKRALERALAGKRPRKIDPGRYTVILEEAPVKDFVDFLGWLGFGAQAFEEGRSFVCGKIGETITGRNISIADDTFHDLSAGLPFDYEGIPKQRVDLIEHGLARGVVYDRAYAARAKTNSTGHALPAGFTYGPLPLNLVMSPGDADVEQMIGSVSRGLLVTRFWYCRVVDPAKTMLTGQTRDGTFLIEDGRIVCGVKDMRFNESILEAFSRAELISRHVRRIGSTITPVMKIEDFRFTETVGEH